MVLERTILTTMWLLGMIGFLFIIPRKKRREGFLAFLMFQALIWLCDMFVFYFGLMSAPIREFPKATDLSITINYFFYPVLFSLFYVYKKGRDHRWKQLTKLLIWITAITILDVLIERYTRLLEYKTITWFGIGIYIGFLFYISDVLCNWFFKNSELLHGERSSTQ